jgi:hypothetical protein
MSGATTFVPRRLGLAFVAALTLGCQGAKAPSPGKPEAASPEAAAPIRVAKVSRERLPALGEPFPQALEGGVLKLSDPPAPWLRLRYSAKRVAAWSTTPQGDFPRMILASEPAASGDPERLRADDLNGLVAFAQRLRDEFAASGEKVVEPPTPMIIGDNAFLRYTKAGRLPNGARVERLLLMTVAAGKRYTLALETLGEQALQEHRDTAYAVAAGMEFVEHVAPAEAPADAADPMPGASPEK